MKKFSAFTIGLAFFSMFFGSGNLVFPLHLGRLAADQWPWVAAGFLLAGVIGPFFGVLSMIAFQGNTKKFFSTLGPIKALFFTTILTAVWIPLGAAPRCITVAYSTLKVHNLAISPWLFGLIYSIAVALVILKASRMIEILGYFLTPILLGLLAILWVFGLWTAPGITVAPQMSNYNLFMDGVVHGYNTMDIIATFFFAASIIHVIQETEPGSAVTIRKSFTSGSIGMITLAIVYTALIYLSAQHASVFENISKDQILPYVTMHFLGKQFSFIPALAIILACFTTSVAMLSVYTSFLHDEYFSKFKYGYAVSMFIGMAISYALSIFTMDQIMSITSPILHIACPLLIVMATVNLVKYLRSQIPLPQDN